MARETEIKLKITDRKAFERHLKRLGARTVNPGSGRVHETNIIFDTPQGGLAKHGQLLRIRTEALDTKTGRFRAKTPTIRYILTFKSPPEHLVAPVAPGATPASTAVAAIESGRRHKIREEIELEVTNAPALQRIFEGLGMRGWFRYEKVRTTYVLSPRLKWARGLLVELDETPIGTYVELEGPGEAIDRAALELGFTSRDYILKNYLVLYLEDCRQRGIEPGNMLFPVRS